jgi:DNA-binding beta-propeller fold protein YncE
MKYVYVVLAIVALVTVTPAQTTNSEYEVMTFGAPLDGEESWGDTISVAADGNGSVLALRRAEPPVLIFNREGELQDTWGDGLFPDKHSIDVDNEGFVWITDRTDQMVYKFTMDGQQLLALGTKGVTGDNSSTDAFNRPSDVAVAPNGDIFVADGYGNSRIVHFSADGRFVKIIGGTEGTGTSEFDVPHGVVFDSRGRLIVLDRQNTTKTPRIQVFDQDGRFIEQWTDLGLMQPSGLAISEDDTVYIGETDGEKITIVKDGTVIDVIGGLESRAHNINLDRGTGVLYLADSNTPGQIKRIVKK